MKDLFLRPDTAVDSRYAHEPVRRRPVGMATSAAALLLAGAVAGVPVAGRAPDAAAQSVPAAEEYCGASYGVSVELDPAATAVPDSDLLYAIEWFRETNTQDVASGGTPEGVTYRVLVTASGETRTELETAEELAQKATDRAAQLSGLDAVEAPDTGYTYSGPAGSADVYFDATCDNTTLPAAVPLR